MSADDLAAGRERGLPIWLWSTLWIGLWVGVSAAAHAAAHGVVNPYQLTLALFLAINVLIAIWEISLFLRIDLIEQRYRERQERRREPASERPRSRSFFLSRVPASRLTSATLWSRVWSEYAKYDPSYADRRSFGFAIDVGNGFTTLVPSLVFLAGMTFPILPPVALGIVGGLIFYQKLYGTLLYFFTFVFNRRYEGHSPAALAAFVGGSNGIWLVFPAVGLFVCFRLLWDRSFDVLWH